MCYVCLQRAQRNFPLYYGDERRRREMEDERLMQQYQILKDQEAFFKNQVALCLIGDRGFAVGQRDHGMPFLDSTEYVLRMLAL
ncbi:hypothetical protein ACRRTK_009691 [Alexandromys fortis]